MAAEPHDVTCNRYCRQQHILSLFVAENGHNIHLEREQHVTDACAHSRRSLPAAAGQRQLQRQVAASLLASIPVSR